MEGMRVIWLWPSLDHLSCTFSWWCYTIHTAVYLTRVDVFKFYSRVVCCFLYSTSICNRSLYSTLLCNDIGLFRSLACSDLLCVVTCPEVMDLNGHVVYFQPWQHLGPTLYPVLPVFRFYCISDMLWKWLDIQCPCIVIKFSFSSWCCYACPIAWSLVVVTVT